MGESNKDLQTYMSERERDLKLLKLDLRCKPFGPGPNRLVLAVDWSEVFAYIFADRPPKEDPLTRVINADLVDAAHLAALTFIFERFPGDVILIPPYVDEMTDLVRVVKEQAVADALSRLQKDRDERLRDVQGTIAEVINKLTDWHSRSESGTADAENRADRFRATLAGEDQALLREWVEANFGRLFLVARLSGVDGLRALSRVLRGADGAPPRLTTLARNRPDLANILVNRPISAASQHAWRDELRRLQRNRADGKERPQTRDAQALAYLERLNPLMHARGEQLIFVTRSTHLPEVMERFPGRFAALGDQYVQVPVRHPDGVCTICRNWRLSFEVAMVWDHVPGEAGGPIEQPVADAIEARMLALQALSKALRGPESVHAADILARALQADVEHHRQVYVSTIRPRLPELSKATDPTRVAVHLFVNYVTDPEWADRPKIREELLQDVAGIMRELRRHALGPASDPWESDPGLCRSATRVFIRCLSDDALSDDVTDNTLREVFEQLFGDLRSGGAGDADLTVMEKLRSLDKELAEHSKESPHNVELARLLVTSLFRVGAIEQQGFFQLRYKRLLEQMRSPSAGWMLNQIMIADIRSLRMTPLAANLRLRRTWREAALAPHADAGTAGRERHVQRLVALATAWLRLHLDWIEQEEELINNFPPAEDDDADRFELEFILDCLQQAISKTPNSSAAGPGSDLIRRPMFTNAIYAAARLAPFVEHLDGPGARKLQLVNERPMTTLVDTHLKSPFVRHTVDALSQFADKTGEELDALAYFLIKEGYWLGAASPDGKARLDQAEGYLSEAQQLLHAPRAPDEAPPGKRLSALLSKHRQLLTEVRATVRFSR